MRPRCICISVSEKNEDTADLLEEFSDHLGMSKSGAFFHIVRDWNRLRLKERIYEMGGGFYNPVHRCDQHITHTEL